MQPQAPTAGAVTALDQVDPEWAWAPYSPDAARPWDRRRAAHLHRRAAFAANWNELQRATADGPAGAVERLLRPTADVGAHTDAYDGYDQASADSENTHPLRAWWLRRMMDTPHPLQETMTLFWHGYFAATASVAPTESAGARPRLMARHVHLLRRLALGSFAELLSQVVHDPAFLLSVGAQSNRKAAPNDRLARVLLHNLTVGEEHCTERGVREAARAFTGWCVPRNEFRYKERDHDDGPKTVLGRTGNWTGEDVVRMALERPATASRVVRRLYRRLVAEDAEPDETLLHPLAASFAEDWDVGRLVERMLKSNLFFSPTAYLRRVRSPVAFAVAMCRAFGAAAPSLPLGRALADLGHDLYSPPSQDGWPDGSRWLGEAALLGRSNLAWALLEPKGPYGGKLDPLAVAGEHGHRGRERAATFLAQLLLPGGTYPSVARAVTAPGDDAVVLRRVAHRLVTLPEFHLA